MRSLLVLVSVLVLLLLFSLPAGAQGRGYYGMGPGMMGGGWSYCPYCGAYQGGGHGWMGGGGYGMMGRGGYGMMGGYGYGRGYGPGRGYGQSEECRTFLSQTRGLRKDLMNKRYEYSEAVQDPKTDSATLSAMEKQIGDLQDKIQAKNTQGCWW